MAVLVHRAIAEWKSSDTAGRECRRVAGRNTRRERKLVDGSGNTSSGCNRADRDFTDRGAEWNRCAVVCKPRLRSTARRLLPVRLDCRVAGAVYKWEDHLSFRQPGTKRGYWTKLPQHRLVAD